MIESAITFTKDWPRQLKHVIGELCKACTMLTCCDTAAGCKIRQEIRKRDKECYQRRAKKRCAQLRRDYRNDPEPFKARCAVYRSRNRERAVEATRAWRAANPNYQRDRRAAAKAGAAL